ncbi:MAG: response regulator [Candidatus Adiutricales bacterium]
MKKILIVDDRAEVRELVEVTLRSSEYISLQAESGEKAIEIAKAERPHLIIMDIMMPGGIDGLETTRILKGDPETRESVIIMLTAKGQEIDREEGFKAGADDYFVKPFSPLDLIRKVDEVLARQKVRGERHGRFESD